MLVWNVETGSLNASSQLLSQYMDRDTHGVILLTGATVATHLLTLGRHYNLTMAEWNWFILVNEVTTWRDNILPGEKIVLLRREIAQSSPRYLPDLPARMVKQAYSLWIMSLATDQLERLTTWHPDHGFAQPFRHIWTPTNFNGKTFTIVTLPLRVFHMQAMEHGQAAWSGICIEILEALATSLNFTYRLVLPPDRKWGSPEADGSWNGMVGMVQRGEVDWALGKFTITNIRDTVVDYTAPFWHESAQIVMKKPSNDALFLYLGPFRHDVWLCLLASVPITTAVTAVTFYVESSWWTPRLDATRIMVGFWWFFAIVVATTYTGNLIAALAVPKTIYPVQSLNDLVEQSTYTYGCTAGAAIYTLIEKSTFDVYQKMWQRSVKYDDNNVKNHEEGIERVKKGNYIYLGEMTGVAPLIYDDCQFAVAKETFYPSSFAFVMPEKSPYLPVFNNIINDLLETGLIERWRADYYPRDVCASIDASQTSVPDPATVRDMIGAFVLLTAGVMLSLFVLTFEVKFNLKFVRRFFGTLRKPDGSHRVCGTN
ncbi:Glutamate receptor ionotropic, kainate 2 [Lamellibrachia satsuma]|nr:Glutamate receptor ionotropic, kainate 2 [Lamellibrachia satsuma]